MRGFLPEKSASSWRLQKKLEGCCLIDAPLVFASSTFFWQNGEYGTDAGALIIFSMFLWIPALMGLFSMVRDKMPRYSVWGLWIAVLGCISGVCFALLGYLASVFNISHEQYIESLSNYPVSSELLLFGTGPLFPVSIFVFGIICTFKKLVPAWIGLLLCLAAAAFPLSRISRIDWMAHTADACLLVPCVMLGATILRNSPRY